MKLNELGQIAYDEWTKTPIIRPNVELDVFIIMPNHIHGIIILHSTGELNSPNIGNELNSPNTANELNSSRIDTELNSPNTANELNSPHIDTELNSPNTANELNSSRIESNSTCIGNKLISSGNDNKLNSIGIENGVFNTPLRSPSNNIGAIIRGYKSSVTKQIRMMNYNIVLWQRNYYEHIIRNEQSYQTISNYIVNNPAKWNERLSKKVCKWDLISVI